MIFNLTSLNGIYDLDIRYRGNKILSAKPKFGYCERGILELLKNKTALKCIPFIERIDPYSSQHYATCFSLMIENALGKQENKNISATRTTLLELERILSHTHYIKKMVKMADNIVLHNIGITIKDLIIDLMEEITGRRMFPSTNYFGCLNLTLSQGNIKLIQGTCKKIEKNIQEFHEMFFNNPSIKSLLEGQASIDQGTENNMTGPFSWITKDESDLRINKPYLSYQDTEIQSILNKKFKAKTNCIYTRTLSLIDDIKTSLKIINAVISAHDIAYFNQDLIKDNFKVPAGDYTSQMETPRGLLTMTVSVNENSTIQKLQIKSPTEMNMFAVNNALNGCKINNIDLAFESLYLSPMEADK